MATWHNYWRAGRWWYSTPPTPLPAGWSIYMTPGDIRLVGGHQRPGGVLLLC